ncbi:hypothetical protein QVD17_25481 [Tagetes erecta]|uniref:Uncharacterized protein n=1 Tax=Tagetes erecta TaxID=13708 RepID=A0AAD8KG23_TARER|nr:hypothetical protein QVD17_25481 [Tagetes erecta]
MEDDDQQLELQLLPTPWRPSDSIRYRSDRIQFPLETATPSLDLQLSVSNSFDFRSSKPENERVEAMKWQAADEFQIAMMEKAYAERVREMTKKEMELAQSEFSRARLMWERAREEVARVEMMKEHAIRRIGNSTCMEITCQACRQTFLR